jgi:hypothetical protein
MNKVNTRPTTADTTTLDLQSQFMALEDSIRAAKAALKGRKKGGMAAALKAAMPDYIAACRAAKAAL